MPAEGGVALSTSRTRAIVITGGACNTAPVVSNTDFVIAADSGYDHALARSIRVDLLIGDLDSISDKSLRHAQDSMVEIEEHPTDKDQTDLDLAIQAAVTRGASQIDIYGGEGGRLGHFLSLPLSIANPDWSAATIAWHTSYGVVRVVHPCLPLRATVRIGQSISLLPVSTAHGVTTSGLRWALTGESLTRGTSLGISNEALTHEISVEIGEGTVLVILERERA